MLLKRDLVDRDYYWCRIESFPNSIFIGKYIVTLKKQYWLVIGESDVQMDTDNIEVIQHTPRLNHTA